MARLAAVPAFLVLVSASLAPAATVYEPVRYEHQSASGRVFYYGGNDPRVFAAAARQECLRDAIAGAVSPTLIYEPAPVFTDCAPYLNVSVYGYTPTDARNEAYASVPRYFRKADLLDAANVAPDGTVLVPAQAPAGLSIDIRPWHPAPRTTTAPSTRPEPHPLLILPKPHDTGTDRSVAQASAAS